MLTAVEIDRAKPSERPYKLGDGKGLWLEVRPTGAKFWRYRFRLPGEASEKLFTIGEYGNKVGQIGLSAAREARNAARALVKQGVNPTSHREQAVTVTMTEGKNTFRAVASEWLEENRPHWSAKYLTQAERALTLNTLPALGDRPIRSITSADVLEVLKPWKKKAAWGKQLQIFMGGIFRFAISHRRAEADPTYAVRGSIKRPPVKHHKPLALAEIPGFLRALDNETGGPQNSIALQLLLRLFVRPGELLAAKWVEFDLDGALWKISGERMKMGETHYVPLPHQAVSLLRELHNLTGWSEWLLPSYSDPLKHMSHPTLCRAIERVGYGDKFSPHGFRATASTALYEMGYRADLIEKQLAHKQRNQSRAAYDQAQFLQERTAMMQDYADVIDAQAEKHAQASKVVPLRKAAKK